MVSKPPKPKQYSRPQGQAGRETSRGEDRREALAFNSIVSINFPLGSNILERSEAVKQCSLPVLKESLHPRAYTYLCDGERNFYQSSMPQPRWPVNDVRDRVLSQARHLRTCLTLLLL